MFVCVRACVWCDRPPAISESTPKPKCEDITNSYQDALLDFVSKHFDLHCSMRSSRPQHGLESNKVVEWLRFKSLALLAVPRKSDGDEADECW